MTAKRRRFAIGIRQGDYALHDLRGDVLGGIASGVVMLPVAMAYGEISGMGPSAAIYGAVAVGFLTAVVGGARGYISGPQVVPAIVMAAVVAEHGNSLAVAMIVGLLAGLMQIGFAVLRLGSFSAYTSYSMLSGFFTAAGILLIVVQILPILGAPRVDDGVIGTVMALPQAVADVNIDSLAVGLTTLAFAVLWRGRISRVLPALFVALIAGTASGMLWFHQAPVLGTIPTGLPDMRLPALSFGLAVDLLKPAFTIALLGSIVGLLLVPMLDSITGGRHDPNRLLAGQGAGNVVGGMTGGMNAASFLNANIGGRTRVAGILAALILLAAMVGLGSFFSEIPAAVLSALLLKVGWDLIDTRFLKRIHRISRHHAAAMLVTLTLALFVDLILAVMAGLIISGFVNSRILEGIEIRQFLSVPLLDSQILGGADLEEGADPFEARIGLMRFPERISVASAREIVRLGSPDIAGHEFVIFDFSRTEFVDDTAANVIGELIVLGIVAQSKSCAISGLSDDVAKILDSMGVLERVPKEHIVSNMEEAAQLARRLLAGG